MGFLGVLFLEEVNYRFDTYISKNDSDTSLQE